MKYCIRCGGDIPAAGAVCAQCRIAFEELVEDSAFLEDDEDDEDDAPVQRGRRAQRWGSYLESAPVRPGRADAEMAGEYVAPASHPEPQATYAPEPSVAAKLDEVFDRMDAPAEEPEPTAQPEPAPEPTVAAELDALFDSMDAPAEEPEPTAQPEPTPEPTVAAELDALFDSMDASVTETAADVTPQPDREPESSVAAELDSVFDRMDAAAADPVAAPHIAQSVAPAHADALESSVSAASTAAEFASVFDRMFEDDEQPQPEPTAAEPDPVLPDPHEHLVTADVGLQANPDPAPVREPEPTPVSERRPEPVTLDVADEVAPDESTLTDDDLVVLPIVDAIDDEPQVEPSRDEAPDGDAQTGRTYVLRPELHPAVDPVTEEIVLPVGFSADGPVVAPLSAVHTGPANVTITPRFELHTAPAEGSPIVHALLDIEPTGAPLVAGTDGPLAHVILALDLSASMNDARKYPVLTRAIENMLADLRRSKGGDVLVSLVVFAYGAEILFRAESAAALDPRHVLAAIDGSTLRFTRYTDIVGALSRAGRIAYDAHRAMPRVPVRIYVLTDGKPQDVEGAQEQMALIRRIPVDVHGLGFGDDADLGTLQALFAGGRGGTIKHVRPDTLSSAFERIAEVAQRVVAKRALLDVELKSGVVGGASYRFRPGRHAYGKNAFARGQHFRADLGTLESGRRYSLLFQLRLTATEQDETEIGRVTLRIPGEGGPVTFERLLFIARHPGADSPEPDAMVLEARHVVEAMDGDDPRAQLNALRARRRLYTEERRDPYLIELLDRAIEEMEKKGSLAALSDGERATLKSHTQSIVGAGS